MDSLAADLGVPTLGFSTPGQFLAIATNIVLGIGLVLTIIFIILSGIKFMTARGDIKAADDAKRALTNSIIGLVIILGAYTIRGVIVSTLGTETPFIEGVSPRESAPRGGGQGGVNLLQSQ